MKQCHHNEEMHVGFLIICVHGQICEFSALEMEILSSAADCLKKCNSYNGLLNRLKFVPDAANWSCGCWH